MLSRVRGVLHRWPHLGPIILICAFVVVANGLYLTGIRASDPVETRAVLAPPAHGLFPGRATIDRNDGYTTQALGRLAANDLLHGHLPLWNEYEGVGAPLLGEMQSAALFPPTLLNALPNGVLWEHILLEMVAGVATYLLLVRLGRSRLAAVTGGASFAVMGVFVWLTNAAFNPVAFLPLSLLAVQGIEDATSARRRTGHWALLGFAVGMSLLAGFPETAVLNGVLVAAFVGLRWWQVRGARLRFAVQIAGGLAVGLAVAAPALIAFFDYLGFAAVGLHSGSFAGTSLPPSALPMAGVPYIYGPIFAQPSDGSTSLDLLWSGVGGYLTVATIAVAAIAFRRRTRQVDVWFFAVAGVLALGRIYGFAPIVWTFDLIPGMSSVGAPRYLPSLVAMCAAVLIAHGIDALNAEGRNPRMVVVGVVAVVAIGVGAVPEVIDSKVPGRWCWFALSLTWAALMLIIVLRGLWHAERQRVGRARRLIAAVVLVDALAMFIVPQFSAPGEVDIDRPAISYLKAHVGLGRIYSISVLAPNYGSYFGFGQLNVNDLPFPKRFEQYAEADLDPGTIAVPIFPGSSAGPARLIHDRSAALLAHMDAFREAGVAYVVTASNQVSLTQARAVGLGLAYSDPFLRIWQMRPAMPYFDSAAPGCKLDPAGRYRVVVDCARASVLIRREMYAPGWTARIGAHEVAISPYAPRGSAVGLFQSVPLPAGRGVLTFNYRPRGFDIARVVAAAGWLSLAAAAGAAVIRRRRGSAMFVQSVTWP